MGRRAGIAYEARHTTEHNYEQLLSICGGAIGEEKKQLMNYEPRHFIQSPGG